MAEEPDDSMDLFTRLVAKQADKEMREVSELPASAERKSLIGALITEIKERGLEMTHSDLVKYQQLGIPPEEVLFAGFIKGVAMPEMDLAEANTEPIGELGVCLNVDSQFFAFHDASDGTVYLPGEQKVQELAVTGTRFLVMACACIKELLTWSGAHGERDGDKVVVKTEGAWYGDPAENVHAQFVRYMFADCTIVYGDEKKLGDITFEIEMRRSMGKM